MFKPKDYDDVKEYGEYRMLPAGNYVCKIMGVEETVSRSGREMIVISLDIAEGEYAGFFASAYRADTREGKKWGCRFWQLIQDTQTGATHRGLKTFHTSVEESNEGFKIAWGEGYENCFKGKLVGVMFRREEYLDNMSVSHWATRPAQFRSVEAIHSADLEVLTDRPLNAAQAGSAVARDPKPLPENLKADFDDGVISDADLPF